MTKKEWKDIKELKRRRKKGMPLYRDVPIKKSGKWFSLMYNWKAHIKELILIINEIPTFQYMYYDDIINTERELVFDEEFMGMSKIAWTEFSLKIDDKDFRGRFVTMLLFYIYNNSESIFKYIWNSMADKEKFNKYETKRDTFKTMLIKLDNFIINFLAKDTIYGAKLVELIPYTMLDMELDKVIDIRDNFIKQKQMILETLDTDGIYNPIIWDSLFKLSYMMATGNTNFKGLPKYNSKADYYDADTIEQNVALLGISILTCRKKHKGIKPILYQMFNESRLEYYSTIDNINNHLELQVGFNAIEFVKFLMDSEKITDWLEDLI